MSKQNIKFNMKYLWYILAIVLLVLDLVTKSLTDGIIYQEGIPGIFSIESYHNPGDRKSVV